MVFGDHGLARGAPFWKSSAFTKKIGFLKQVQKVDSFCYHQRFFHLEPEEKIHELQKEIEKLKNQLTLRNFSYSK
jgi:hypothetical protein